MDRSGFFESNRLPGGTALGYIKDAAGWRTNIYNLPVIGASDGGAYTTLDDLDRLWSAFWNGAILSPELVDLYASPHAGAGPERPDVSYGHGLWIRERPETGREHWLEGCDAGVSFRSTVNRDAERRITVLSNTTDGAWPILRALATIN
jgi:hypothetical protein